MRVLLVDDEKELVSAMAERLSFRGIQADWETDAKTAVERVRENAYDVVVLDMKMPGMSGLVAMRRIQEIRPGMGFVFLTGHGSTEDRNECIEAGVAHYLMKPLKIDVLIEKMKEAAQGAKNSSGPA